ncbi:MAG TPA: hypothetical protein VHV49_17815, partial [Pseudonocardiaceae bacterium]|nr:hypothetical protein [Pseudonocardiaceae bacterium]
MATEHLWITGARRIDRLNHPEVTGEHTVVTSAHRGLRGPCTGMDAVLATVLPDAYRRWPHLVEAHRGELLYGIPELAELIGPAPDDLARTSPPLERTRFYGPTMLRCISQGIVTFLIALARERLKSGEQALRLVFDDVHEADGTVAEFIALLLRRADPAAVQVVVCAADVPLWPELEQALTRYARRARAFAAPAAPDDRTAAELVRAFVS